MIAQRLHNSFETLLLLLKTISPSELKKKTVTKNSDLTREINFMRQVFQGTEENLERIELKKEFYTSYQQSFYKEFKSIQLALKNINVIHKRTDNSMSLWNLIQNFDSLGKSNYFFIF